MLRKRQPLARSTAHTAAPGATGGNTIRRAIWKLVIGVSLVAATVLLRGATPSVADTDYGVTIPGSNPLTGYWQICTQYCWNESINYTYQGWWDVDTWNCTNKPGCQYNYYVDYESQPSTGAVIATGDAINGYCCPDVQVTIAPDEYVIECYHSRSDCGKQYVPYRMKYDENRDGYSVSCTYNDNCKGYQVQGDEQEGFVDPFVVMSACEVAVGQAVPAGGTCDGRGYMYDFGQ